MPDDKDKSQREAQAFREFIGRSGLKADLSSLEECCPPAPIILCQISGEGSVAFALVEITNRDSAKFGYSHPEATAENILKEERDRSSKYKSPHPIDLIVYTGNAIEPPERIENIIKRLLNNSRSKFNRVWFMGQSGEICRRVLPFE